MQLPVSGLEVKFRAPDGNDDLAILEATGGVVERALAALPRLARTKEQDNAGAVNQPSWAALTVTDFEATLLGLRSFLFGDTVRCLFRDRSHQCVERMELEFSIAAFLEEVHPAAPRGVRPVEGDRIWFWMTGNDDPGVRFRLPAVDDQVRVLGERRPAALLARRCIDAENIGARRLARIERAMEALAPLVSRPLKGNCPGCGQPLTVPLHVPRLVMDELQKSAAGVYEEVHAIAAAYHWDEAAVLAMPQRRRRAYAEAIRRRDRAVV